MLSCAAESIADALPGFTASHRLCTSAISIEFAPLQSRSHLQTWYSSFSSTATLSLSSSHELLHRHLISKLATSGLLPTCYSTALFLLSINLSQQQRLHTELTRIASPVFAWLASCVVWANSTSYPVFLLPSRFMLVVLPRTSSNSWFIAVHAQISIPEFSDLNFPINAFYRLNFRVSLRLCLQNCCRSCGAHKSSELPTYLVVIITPS